MLRRACVLLAGLLAGSAAFGSPQYYNIADHDAAQREARTENLPLAWVGGYNGDLEVSIPDPGSDAEREQSVVNALQGRAVVIFFDGQNMSPVPPIVHAQFHIHDDGDLPDGAAWLTPKIVFTNPEVTKTLGRVSRTQLVASGMAPLYFALQAISNDPTALQVPPPPPPPPPAAAISADGTETDETGTNSSGLQQYDTRFGKISLPPMVVAFLNKNQQYLIPALIGLIVLWIVLRILRMIARLFLRLFRRKS